MGIDRRSLYLHQSTLVSKFISKFSTEDWQGNQNKIAVHLVQDWKGIELPLVATWVNIIKKEREAPFFYLCADVAIALKSKTNMNIAKKFKIACKVVT